MSKEKKKLVFNIAVIGLSGTEQVCDQLNVLVDFKLV